MPVRPPGSAPPPRPPRKGAGASSAKDARSQSAQTEVALLSAEGDAASEKSTAAALYHEAGHILEMELADGKASARSYKNALTADPTYQPTAWALRRQLTTRGQWENLLRVLDAEARFASNTRSQDRADLLLERGWLLREQLGRVEEAHASFVQAVELHPGNRAAWLALLMHALSKGPIADVPKAFEGLVANAQDVADRAVWASAFAAWLQWPQTRELLGIDAASATQRAATQLLGALDAGAEQPFMLATLDRLSLQPGNAALRMPVLDRLILVAGQDERQAHAVAARLSAMRERARRLVAEGSLTAAAEQLDAALALEPEHPLVAADRLDLAMLEGRLDIFDDWQARATAPVVEAELLLRRADVALRQGAWGEAMGAIAKVSPALELQDLCFVESVRTLAGLSDAQGLADAYEAHAELLWARHREAAEPGAKDLAEVAHLFVRAGALWEVELADSLHAEALYGQALALASTYRPALEGLASVFTREGRWENLVELVAADASAAATSERATALRESLVLLNRDLLSDLPAALAAQKLLVQATPNDVRALFRWLDLAARMASSDDAAVDDALEAVARLHRLAKTTQGKSALCHLAVWLVQGGRRDYEADVWLERALASEPRALAAAFVERRERVDSVRARTVLMRELEAWTRQPGSDQRVRALRFRQAFRALESGDPAQAVAELQPLAATDPAALCWQLDIARRARDPQLLRRLLAGVMGANAEPLRAELGVLLGECLEAAGRRAEAAVAYAQIPAAVTYQVPTEFVLRASLGRLRVAAAETDIAGVVGALNDLAASLPNSLGEDLAREAQHVLVATGGGLTANADNAADPVLEFMAALRGKDEEFLARLRQLAEAALPGAARADLWFVLTLSLLAQGKANSVEALRQAYQEAPCAELELVFTDLVGEADPKLDPKLAAARLQHLGESADAHDEPSAALASLLALEIATLAESQAQLRAAAVAYAKVLRWRPDSLEALEGLRRLAQLAGARNDEARLLERIADTLVSAKAAAEHYAEAALLFEADGDAANAIRLFYKVLSRAPQDDEAFERLLALLREDKQWSRVERLLGFKLGQLGHTGRRCCPLWIERAQIRLAQLGDSKGSVADWWRAAYADPTAFEPQWRLGQAAQAQAATQSARRRFETALKAPHHDPVAKVECVLDLADVCALTHDLEAARLHLRAATQAFTQFPSLVGGLSDRLVNQCVRARCAEVAITALESLAAASSGAERATYLLRVARLWRESPDHPKSNQQTAQALLSALQADAFADAAVELATLQPTWALTPEQCNLVQAAQGQVLDNVSNQGLFNVRGLELILAYSTLLSQSWRQAMAGQLLFMLGHGTTRGRARNVSGSFDEQSLFALGAEGAVPHDTQVIQAAWPGLHEAVAKAFAIASPLPPLGRATRINAREEARVGWVEAAAQALGLHELEVHQVGNEGLVAVAGGASQVLVLGAGLLGGDGSSRFRVARALALLRLGMPFAITNDAEAISWVAAALAVATESEGLASAKTSSQGQKLQRAFSRRSLRSLEVLQPELARVTLADVQAWVAQGLRASERFALVVSGDLAAAAFTLAGGRKLEAVKASAAAQALMRFALSNECGQLRSQLGLEQGTGDHA